MVRAAHTTISCCDLMCGRGVLARSARKSHQQYQWLGSLPLNPMESGASYALKHRQRRFDGQYRWVETRAAAMRNSDDAIVQWNVICLDIDGEVRAQEELRLAQERLARTSQAVSLAELSASIAHEINQPLTAVVTNGDACLRWLQRDHPDLDEACAAVQRVVREGRRASDVLTRIRGLVQ